MILFFSLKACEGPDASPSPSLPDLHSQDDGLRDQGHAAPRLTLSLSAFVVIVSAAWTGMAALRAAATPATPRAKTTRTADANRERERGPSTGTDSAVTESIAPDGWNVAKIAGTARPEPDPDVSLPPAGKQKIGVNSLCKTR